MKNYFLLLVLSIGTLIACKDDDPVNANGIEGHWEWVQTYGGFGGITTTPASSGNTMHLEIDENTYKEFRNDSLVLQSEYEVETRVDSLFGTDKVLALETGYELAILQQGDTLRLFEICFDCFEFTYVRE